jgi:site-specific DNA-cytosine methylase
VLSLGAMARIARAGAKNHEDPGNPCVRSFGIGNRIGRGGRPSPTAVVSGAATSAPLIGKRPMGAPGDYAARIARELPREAPPRCGLRLAEFFCCGGGIGLGFRSAGFELAFANDINAKAAATYERNLGHAPVVRDIRAVGPADYPEGAVDVVTGGFPCVTFSMAGRRKGVVDDVNGKLYLELCRVIAELRPRYFVAENVEGILTANNGAAVKLVLAAFLRLGYRAAHELVNMAEHGVPQTRKRVIFVGVRLDEWRGSFAFPARTHRLHGDARATKWLPLARTLRAAIGDLPPPGERLVVGTYADAYTKKGGEWVPTKSNYQHPAPKGANRPAVTQVATGGGLLVVEQAAVSSHAANDAPVSAPHAMSKRVARGGRRAPTVVSEAANVQPFVAQHEVNPAPPYDFSQTRVAVGHASPAPTMSTPPVNPLRPPASAPGVTMTAGGAAEVALSNGGMRRMTVRECARVQSFPDWCDFGESQHDGYYQVGNAVPPLYAKRLALAILEYDARKVIGK